MHSSARNRPVARSWKSRAFAVELVIMLNVAAGCHAIPFSGDVDATANVNAEIRGSLDAGIRGTVDIRLPAAVDAGPVLPVVVRPGSAGHEPPRIAVIDVDGLLLNQNLTGPYSAGENPVALFREKLEAAAHDPRVRGVVLRIHSPGGSVAATDLMAEEFRRFRRDTGKPAVACLLDVATGGALYLAVGCDRIVAIPTSITGGIGALVNHANLQDAMAQLNVRVETVKAGDKLDMGTVTAPLSDDVRTLFQQMADDFAERFRSRVVTRRPMMTPDDLSGVGDGRIVTGIRALSLHLVDAVGYPEDAITEAERLAHCPGSEVVIFQRAGYPARSIYAVTPNTPLQSELIPFSYPGLDRIKLPTFLYLWQPDPTLARQGGR